MPGTVVVGCQFGDEGKGKVIDYLAERADIVVRFQGGANAGHTVQVGEELYAFHLVPSGILRPRTMNVIANGVVVEPGVLLQELDDLRKRGHRAENLRISDRAHVVMPYHKVQDRVEEDLKGKFKAGTTGRGIGPCYQDKVGRFGIRIADLLDPTVLKDKLETIVPIKQRLLEAYGSHEVLNGGAIFSEYAKYGERLAPYVTDTSILLDREVRAGKRILFEGAHGALLDIDHGIYPFGVSSNCVAPAAAIGSGIGLGAINEVIGVVKAFTSRVGTGPVPTELQDKTGDHLRERGGGEFGTTTHRPRRIGWLDLVMLRAAARVNLGEAGRLNRQALAFQQGEDAFLARLHPPRRLPIQPVDLVRVVIARLRVRGDEAFVVAQHHLARRLRDHVIRPDRDLAAAARRIDDELRHRVAAGVAAQPFDDLDALRHGRAEVAGAVDQVALI